MTTVKLNKEVKSDSVARDLQNPSWKWISTIEVG
jgi:hypothetical protein